MRDAADWRSRPRSAPAPRASRASRATGAGSARTAHTARIGSRRAICAAVMQQSATGAGKLYLFSAVLSTCGTAIALYDAVDQFLARQPPTSVGIASSACLAVAFALKVPYLWERVLSVISLLAMSVLWFGVLFISLAGL